MDFIEKLPRVLPQKSLAKEAIEQAHSTKSKVYLLPSPEGQTAEELEELAYTNLRAKGIKIRTKASQSKGLWGGTSTALPKSLYLSQWFHQSSIQDRVETLWHEWYHYERRELFAPFLWDLNYVRSPEFAWVEEVLAYRESLRRIFFFGATEEKMKASAEHSAQSLSRYLVIRRRSDAAEQALKSFFGALTISKVVGKVRYKKAA